MTFLSASFAILLVLAFLAYQFLPNRARVPGLLLASVIFYASLSAPRLLVALAVSTLVGFLAALAMARAASPAGRWRWLWAGITTNLLVLFLVREQSHWLALLTTVWPSAWGKPPAVPSAVVATGVSFFVFQSVSYLVDVFLGTTPPTRRLGHFLLYMAFFPRVLQGPVERAGEFLPQISQPRAFSYEQARTGLLLILWGALKKGVVGDNLAPFVKTVFGAPQCANGLDLLLGVYAFYLQLYFDFSGYSDIAVGTARLFGIELTQNFRNPLSATSMPEFWRRWHISFSRWILDYLFRPLSLWWRAWGKAGTAAALFVAFQLSSLWHGLAATFLVWGGIHGIAMGLSLVTGPWRKRLVRRWPFLGGRGAGFAGWLVTFHVTCLAWIFFHARSLSLAWSYCVGLGSLLLEGIPLFWARRPSYLVGLTLVFVLLVEGFWRHAPRGRAFFAWPRPVRWACYYALITLYWLGSSSVKQQGFIYFQF